MASISRLMLLQRAVARVPTCSMRAFASGGGAGSRSSKGQGSTGEVASSSSAGAGRATAALSHEMSVESLQQEFEHSSSSEEIVAAERDSIDPMMLARKSNTLAPSSVADSSPQSDTQPQERASGGAGTQTAQGYVDPGVKPVDMAKKSRAAMNRGGEYLDGGSRARGGGDQVREG